ncbi:hypothetical protein JNK13_05235 [bacterium]|nr:hypothetical protein [bacterium]
MALKNAKAFFPTYIYKTKLLRSKASAFNAELLAECLQLRLDDSAGVKWSKQNYIGGYTSYASMPLIHKMSSTFERLEREISKHVASFCKTLEFDLRDDQTGPGKLTMGDCWVNIMPAQVSHSFHIHPQSVISGTYYVAVPKGAAGIRFEDPRINNFMAAPLRKKNCRPENQNHVTLIPQASDLILFESWLRHEVPASSCDKERISISFNYNWV